MLIKRSITESARLANIHKADAIVISGDATGDAPVLNDLDNAKSGSDIPVIIGRGLEPNNASNLLGHCDGAIVGTALMKEKIVNVENVKTLLNSIGRLS